jgi:hypothetical protein
MRDCPPMHRRAEELDAGMTSIRSAPPDRGEVRLIVRRPSENEREVLDRARLDTGDGLVGDDWRARGSGSRPDGSADPQAQLTLVNARVAAVIMGGIDRWAMAGDQVFVDLDLSEANLPAGTRLAVGEAQIELTAKVHKGCAKYAARFGQDALRFVSSPEGRALRLRGANARVIRGGTIRPGDHVLRMDG